MDRTYVMVKPDGVQRNLVGEIIHRFERKGFKIVGMKLLRLTPEMAAQHYAEHVGKPFFQGLVDYITSGPVVAMVLAGGNVVTGVRQMMGATDPQTAAPGTIRGDYGLDIGRNVIHGADSPASALREIGLYFQEKELVDYEKTEENWIYEP
jgi:nucleoside-diphosphate kinase